MTFEAVGGNGVITYALNEVTRNSPVPQPIVEATCDAEWVSDLTVAEDITFVVAANEGEARETKVVVSYGEQAFDVAVKQAAKGEEPQPEYVMNVELAAAARIPSDELGIADNEFALGFVDDAENIQLGFVLTGEEGDTVLKAGEYKAEQGEMYTYEPEAEYTFVDGDVVVNVEEEIYSFDITMKDADDKLYHFTYEGTVMDMEPQGGQMVSENFEPVKVVACRQVYWDLGNFEVDLYINDEYYHSLDMQDLTNPNENYLSEGFYTMDNGGVTSWSNMIADVVTGEGAFMVAAEVTITHNEDGTTNIKGFMESEYNVHLDFDWTGVVEGFNFSGETPEPGEDYAFNAPYLYGEYYSPEDMGISAHNYYVILSNDVEFDGETPNPNHTYFFIDFYAATTDDTHTIPNGVYTLDLEDSCYAGTCGGYYTYGMEVNAEGEYGWIIPNEGTVTVTDGKIVAEFVLDDGRNATITYEGNLSLNPYDDGGNTGGNTGANSTLTSDLVLDGTNFTYHAEYYGDWYSSDTDNWWITIYEDDETKSGRYFQLDLLADYYADNWGLEYKPWEVGNLVNTYVPGTIENSSLSGCWYAELTENSISGDMAPITGGTIDVTFNADGTKTFTFDCVDDAGNAITGSITAAAPASTYAAKMAGEKHAIKLPTMSKIARR